MSYFSEENNEDRDELRHEIRREMKREVRRKKMSRCSSCCAAVVLVILALVFLVSFVLAKSGLVNVPFFTNWFYQAPKPDRVVDIQTSAAPAIESLSQQLESQKSASLDLKISEADLSAILKTAAGTALANNFQISIKPEKLEFFGQIPQVANAFLTLGILPKVVGGQLALELASVKIGNMLLPASAANFLLKDFVSQELKKINEFLSSKGELESIDLYDGYLEIKGKRK